MKKETMNLKEKGRVIREALEGGKGRRNIEIKLQSQKQTKTHIAIAANMMKV